MDGVPFTQYEQGESSLTLFNLPVECVLTIVTLLDPAANTALEGLYKSGDAYCTQCEAEGFRRITYYLDRPDILARYSTRITADKSQFPFLLSNGNKVDSGDLGDVPLRAVAGSLPQAELPVCLGGRGLRR